MIVPLIGAGRRNKFKSRAGNLPEAIRYPDLGIFKVLHEPRLFVGIREKFSYALIAEIRIDDNDFLSLADSRKRQVNDDSRFSLARKGTRYHYDLFVGDKLFLELYAESAYRLGISAVTVGSDIRSASAAAFFQIDERQDGEYRKIYHVTKLSGRRHGSRHERNQKHKYESCGCPCKRALYHRRFRVEFVVRLGGQRRRFTNYERGIIDHVDRDLRVACDRRIQHIVSALRG